MPLHRQQFDGDVLVEEVPPPADTPQLSPGRTYWWDGTAWIPSRGCPEAEAQIAAELAQPLIAPLEPRPTAPVAPLKRLPVPKPLEEVLPEPEPEPEPELPPDLEWVAPVVLGGVTRPVDAPALPEVRWPFLETLDKAGTAALVAAVALCWVPRFGALLALGLAFVAAALKAFTPSRLTIAAVAVAVPELVVGLLLHHHAAGVASAKAHNVAVLTRALQNAAQFEEVTHTYESKFGGPIALGQHGWTKDELIEFVHVERNGYCLSATRNGVTLTVRDDQVVSSLPC